MTVTTRRAREKEERRAAIVAAADAVFRDKGFEQATMDDIAAVAELSKGTLYLYFKSKDDLFAALSSRFLAGVVGELEELARLAPTGIEALRAMMVRHARFVIGDPQHFRTVVGRLASGHLFDDSTPEFARFREVTTRLVDAFVAAIARGQEDGTIRAELDAVEIASQLWGGFIGTMLISINSDEMVRRCDRSMSFGNITEGFVELVCNGLRPTRLETGSL